MINTLRGLFAFALIAVGADAVALVLTATGVIDGELERGVALAILVLITALQCALSVGIYRDLRKQQAKG